MQRLAERPTRDAWTYLAVVVALISGGALGLFSAGAFAIGMVLALVAGFSALWSP